MTLVLRKIDDLKPWTKLADEDLTEMTANPPLWAIRLFIPSIKDKGSLSFFEVENNDEAEAIAAAFNFRFFESWSQQISFIAVERKSIEEAGFAIETSLGTLNHTMDLAHRGISPQTIEGSIKLAALFVQGEPIIFNGKKLIERAKGDARSNHFDFPPIAKEKKFGAANLLKFIGDQVVIPQAGERASNVLQR